MDIFFIVDIVVTFNTGIFTDGDYEDSRKVVASKYIKDFFLVPSPCLPDATRVCKAWRLRREAR